MVGSLPEKAPPPCAPQPPYVSMIILRPVRPASPWGPPITKRPAHTPTGCQAFAQNSHGPITRVSVLRAFSQQMDEFVISEVTSRLHNPCALLQKHWLPYWSVLTNTAPRDVATEACSTFVVMPICPAGSQLSSMERPQHSRKAPAGKAALSKVEISWRRVTHRRG